MKCLYMDNFRGFQDTIMPIKDVNFLVGENSTGKTSILSLLNVLSNSSFWMTGKPIFDLEETKLGNFSDIVSAKSKDKSYFRVGMCLTEGGKEGKSHSAYLITFKEKEGVPAVSRYTYLTDKKLIDVIFSSKSLRYKYEDTGELEKGNSESARQWFDNWRSKHDERIVDYRSIKTAISSFLRSSLGALNAYLLEEEEDHPKGRGRYFSFGWSMPYKQTTWLAPIRTKPKRTYDEYNLEFSPEGEHTPYLIKKYFRKVEDKAKFLQFINKFGIESGLFRTIEIKNFGRAVTSPFELDIALDGTILKIVNVGYGVSQVLPVIVELFEREKNSCFLIQQPEIHLHPRAQAAIGNLFFGLNVTENKSFFIETHSDFIIDSFRLKYRNKKNKKPEAQILYFERYEEGNRLDQIEILSNGELVAEQPKGYREFFIKEQMRLLGF